MKTIFITSFHPIISRNILATSLIDRLLEKGARVVILTFNKKKEFFEEEFSRERVIVEGAEKKLAWRDAFLRYLSLAALNTNSLAIKRKTEMRGSGSWLALLIGNQKWPRKLVRKLNLLLTPKNAFADLFNRYQPDLVFSTDVQNEFDARIIRESKSRNVLAVGMVRSWDNLAAKGLIRIVLDKLIVQNEFAKKSAVDLHGIPEEIIEIVGIPHYDLYLTGQRMERKEFFAKIGADPKKKLVIFAPTGDRYIKNNSVDRDILEILDKNLPPDCQILVRFPPTDTVSGLDVRKNEGRIIFDRPSTRFKTLKNTELSKVDDAHLADTLYWSDLVVSGPSTICVDAAFFDKPVILAGFDGYESRSYLQSVRRYFDYDHFQPILKSGGVKFAENPEELLKFANDYLDNPELDSAGRLRIVNEQCWRGGGQATERLANVLLSILNG